MVYLLPFLYWCMAMVYGPPFVTKVIYIHVTKVISNPGPGPQTLSPQTSEALLLQ